MTVRQLAFAFSPALHLTEAEFLPAEANRAALEWLQRTAGWPHRRLALWGGAGSGKTHLLHVWAAGHRAALVPGSALPRDWPDRPLAIDGIDAAGEEALLHVLNAAAEAGQPVLMASREPPARLPLRLPDLASRLRATTAVEIAPADDELLATLLAKALADRQLTVSSDMMGWLLARLPRTPAAMLLTAERLDRTTLAAQRGVTPPLAVEALADLLSG